MTLNGISLPIRGSKVNETDSALNRVDEVEDLLDAVQKLILPFIRSADEDAVAKETGHGLAVPGGGPRTALVEHHRPQKLLKLLDFQLPEGEGKGRDGLMAMIENVLHYSVNTWDQGYMHSLYSSTNAVGVISELILAVLNTNLHVYDVSPALTVIEKKTAKTFAGLFGFNGPHAGGISTQGGSAANTTALVIARNTLFPTTKTEGNGSYDFVLFTSADGHYSLEKAAQMCGLGSSAVISIPVDSHGCMIPSALEEAIKDAESLNKTPLMVNATAGTTVLGSFDPLSQISQICKAHNLWMHIDASWGGPVIFSYTHKNKLHGSHLADSIAVNPHKMMNVPLTCSFLLTNDLTKFHRANTLPAGYLFHGNGDVNDDADTSSSSSGDAEVWDLADLTLQCGRRGDSLKLALSWLYYGPTHYGSIIDHAFDTTAYLATLVASHPNLILVSENPPPCLQVCLYYAPEGKLSDAKEANTRTTKRIQAALVRRGFMVDYAPGERGSFFRVVVHTGTRRGTVEGLVKAIGEVGEEGESNKWPI